MSQEVYNNFGNSVKNLRSQRHKLKTLHHVAYDNRYNKAGDSNIIARI